MSLGHSRTAFPPAARKRSRASRASGALGTDPAKSSTMTRWKDSRRCAAATHASPPLLPGPATTRIGAPLSAAIARAATAVASPARCMSVGPASPSDARSSSVRISAVARSGGAFTGWWCAGRGRCPSPREACRASRWRSAGRGSPCAASAERTMRLGGDHEVAQLDQVVGDAEVRVELVDLLLQQVDAVQRALQALVGAHDAHVAPHDAAELVPVVRDDHLLVGVGDAALVPGAGAPARRRAAVGEDVRGGRLGEDQALRAGELEARRLAPCRPVQATSPRA